MNLEIGKTYYRKVQFQATVRLITKIDEEFVYFEVLHGAPSVMRKGQRHRLGKQKINRFKRWMTGPTPNDDFKLLDGCKIDKTYLILSTQGKPLVRASERWVRRLKKKLITIDQTTYQIVDSQYEEHLRFMWGEELDNNPYFTADKNSQCVVCGKHYKLTRHHVLPVRHKQKLPKPIRQWLGNVLFVCFDCHKTYEQHSQFEPVVYLEQDPIGFVLAWEKHFLDIMKPQFLPKGWKLLQKTAEEISKMSKRE